jgi:hypothetical protein
MIVRIFSGMIGGARVIMDLINVLGDLTENVAESPEDKSSGNIGQIRAGMKEVAEAEVSFGSGAMMRKAR